MNPDLLKLVITKALAYTENGGNVALDKTKAGKSGELKSVFQFLPETWKRDAKKVTGNENLPLTPENEALVAHGVISPIVDKGLAEGKSTDEIATEVGSFWNSGKTSGAKEGLIGTNKKGVKYDVPAYAKKVTDYTNKFLKETGGEVATNSTADNKNTNEAILKAEKLITHIKENNPEAIQENSQQKELAIAPEAPLPQNNNLNQGMIPQSMPNTGMLS